MTPQDTGRLVDRHDQGHGQLIGILQDIQSEYGYLPEQALRSVAGRTGRSLVEIFGVATFYRSFSLKPRGKHTISVCTGTACHVRGGPAVLDEFRRQLDIRPGQTTPDKQFTLETVNCMGACALGPVVVIDGHYFPKVRKSKVKHLIGSALKGFETTDIRKDRRVFPIAVSCPHCNHSLMDKQFTIHGYPSIRLSISYDHRHGWARLSSLYGDYNVSVEHDVPADTIVNYFCPHCHARLVGSWTCPACGAPMVQMTVRGGGIVQVCSRRGCKSHMLDVG